MAASDSPTTVKQSQLGCLFFDFVPPRAFEKTYTKCYTNNYLLSYEKTISSLLELIDHVLPISEYVLEKH